MCMLWALPAQPVPVPDPLDKYQDKKLYKRGWNGVNYPRDELEKEGTPQHTHTYTHRP